MATEKKQKLIGVKLASDESKTTVSNGNKIRSKFIYIDFHSPILLSCFQTIEILIQRIQNKKLASHLASKSSHSSKWKAFRKECYSPGGPLHMYQDFSYKDHRGLLRFKEHIFDIINHFNESYLRKISSGSQPLCLERDCHQLFEDWQREEVRIRREKEDAQQKKAQDEADRVRMREINEEQGLTPPIPITATTTTTSRSEYSNTSSSNAASTSSSSAAAATSRVTTNVVATDIRTEQVTPMPLTPATRRRTNDEPVPLEATNGRQVRRRTSIDDNGRNLRSYLRHTNHPNGNQVGTTIQNNRVPHNDRPSDRHLDMIDRIDRGETITNNAMLQLSQTIRCDRQKKSDPASILNSVVGFLNLPPRPGFDNLDVYQLASSFTKETLNNAMQTRNNIDNDGEDN